MGKLLENIRIFYLLVWPLKVLWKTCDLADSEGGLAT